MEVKRPKVVIVRNFHKKCSSSWEDRGRKPPKILTFSKPKETPILILKLWSVLKWSVGGKLYQEYFKVTITWVRQFQYIWWQSFGNSTFGNVFLVTRTSGDKHIWWPIILVTRTFGHKTFRDKLWGTPGIKMFLPWTIRSYQTTSKWTLLPKLVRHNNFTVNKYFYRSWRLKYSQIPYNIVKIRSLINLKESWLFSFDIRIACGEQIYLSPIIRSPDVHITKSFCNQN